ncbi:MAG TPA: hypothetical protein VJ302_03845 [Blastocatellia bacterium]|nr:hypothetical protein [Blastocatellia bacterium]
MNHMTRCGNVLRSVCLGALGGWVYLMLNLSVGAGVPAAGIRCDREAERGFSALHEAALVRSLRRITGIEELCFTPEGVLSVGSLSSATAGSSVARQILWCALGSGKLFMIEDHSESPTVNFGQLDEGTNYEDLISQRQLEIWRVRLDFHDFNEMVASDEVRATFDPGFTMLHELLHGLGYKDALTENEVGACEELLNQARAELNLPLRDRYFGESVRLASHQLTVRLRFRHEIKLRDQSGPAERPSRRLQYLYFLVPYGAGAPPSHKGVIMPNSRFLP